MIKRLAWDIFKKTGNINTFLEYKQITDVENEMENIDEIKDIQKITDINVENKE